MTLTLDHERVYFVNGVKTPHTCVRAVHDAWNALALHTLPSLDVLLSGQFGECMRCIVLKIHVYSLIDIDAPPSAADAGGGCICACGCAVGCAGVCWCVRSCSITPSMYERTLLNCALLLNDAAALFVSCCCCIDDDGGDDDDDDVVDDKRRCMSASVRASNVRRSASNSSYTYCGIDVDDDDDDDDDEHDDDADDDDESLFLAACSCRRLYANVDLHTSYPTHTHTHTHTHKVLHACNVR